MLMRRQGGRTAQGHGRSRAGDPDAAALRRVGWRLAAVTVGLLSALLLVLGLMVYLTTQQVLLGSLQTTVQRRAENAVSFGQPGPPHVDPSPRRIGPSPEPPPRFSGRIDFSDGVFTTIVDQTLRVINTGPFTTTLADSDAARQVLRGRPPFFSTRQVDRYGPYLIYSMRAGLPQPTGGATTVVVQTRLSERQYQNSLHTLLGILLTVSALGLLASALISGVLAGFALRPIRAALRRQRDFVADAAHELRTPLAIQRTTDELGLAAGTLGELQATIEQSLSQNAHLTRLVEDLSTLARADSGVVSLERAPVDLACLVTETVEGVAALAEDRGVRLVVVAPDATRVVGDAGRLRQVLLILLDNALKHTPAGGTVTVSVGRQGARVHLQVRDSGPGIATEDLPHLFDRFYRADRARTGEGSGLGLAIGRWIAEAHGGQIAAANAPACGALFTVTLPLAAP